jgi:glutamate dehydrogenase (NADP+)
MIAKAAPHFSLSEKTTLVAISGSGNVAQYTALKVIELGATVLSLSDSKGSLIAPASGYTKELILRIGELKLRGGSLQELSQEEGYTYHHGALSSATS